MLGYLGFHSVSGLNVFNPKILLKWLEVLVWGVEQFGALRAWVPPHCATAWSGLNPNLQGV